MTTAVPTDFTKCAIEPRDAAAFKGSRFYGIIATAVVLTRHRHTLVNVCNNMDYNDTDEIGHKTRFVVRCLIGLTPDEWEPNYFDSTVSYHGCWCPGSLRRQDISSHDIDYVEYVTSCLTWGRNTITCAISVWKNDINWRYILCSIWKTN